MGSNCLGSQFVLAQISQVHTLPLFSDCYFHGIFYFQVLRKVEKFGSEFSCPVYFLSPCCLPCSHCFLVCISLLQRKWNNKKKMYIFICTFFKEKYPFPGNKEGKFPSKSNHLNSAKERSAYRNVFYTVFIEISCPIFLGCITPK